MTTLNQGRNEMRLNNSGGRCLLENWVEERAVDQIDHHDLNNETTSGAKMFKDGHNGLLTTDFAGGVEKLTTVRDSYRPPRGAGVRQTGKKQELLEQMLYEQVSKQVDDEFNMPPENDPLSSTYRLDYNIEGFVPTEEEPTAAHDYVSEAPVSFWTEHKDKMHGISQIKPTFDSPFRKNASFSKPIDECFDQPKPYEMENIPNM